VDSAEPDGPPPDADDQSALTEAIAAVAFCREMAALDADNLPDLAAALAQLSTLFARAGRWAEAVAPAEEAVQIERFAVDSDGLVAALYTVERRLGEAGRATEAVAAADEAAELYRRLVAGADDDRRYRRSLAAVLTDRGHWSAELGRLDEAIDATEEAIRLRRLLVVDDDTVGPGLAQSLVHLGHYRTVSGDLAGGLAATEESMAIVRSLAAADHEAHLPEFTKTLAELAVALFAAGRYTEGRETAREAARLSCELVGAVGDSALPTLGRTLSNLALMLTSADDVTDAGTDSDADNDAVVVCREAVDVLRRLVAINPDVHQPALGRALTTLAITLSNAERTAEATAAAQEGLDIQRDLMAVDPARAAHAYAAAAKLLAMLLLTGGQAEESLTVVREALAHVEPLASVGNGDVHRAVVAGLTESLGDAFLAVGRFADAVAAYDDAISGCRLLVASDRSANLASLASTLSNAACGLAEAGYTAEAIPLAREARDHYRELVDNDPVTFDSVAAQTEQLVISLTATTSAD
jgi:tetratricopeptide (TPR) repeat protein